MVYKRSPFAVLVSPITTVLRAQSIRQSVQSEPLLKTNKHALLALLASTATRLQTTLTTVKKLIVTTLMGIFAEVELGHQNLS